MSSRIPPPCPPISGPISKRRTPTRRPRSRAPSHCARRSSPRCAPASARTTAACRSPTARYAYYTRHREGGQHPLVCRRPRTVIVLPGAGRRDRADGGPERARSSSSTATARARASPSSSSRRRSIPTTIGRLAWSADTKGSELYSIRVRDLATGEDCADRVEATSGEVVWAADGPALLLRRRWTTTIARHGSCATASARRRTTTPWSTRSAIPASSSISRRRSRATYLTVTASDHETSEVHLLDRARGGRRPHRGPAARAAADLLGRALGQPPLHPHQCRRGRGLQDRRPPGSTTPGRENWGDVIPHRPGVMIRHQHVIADHLVRLEIENARPRIVVRDTKGNEHAVAFAEEAYSLGLQPGHEFETAVIRFTYSSMTTPAETYDYDCVTRARQLRKRQAVPSGHDPAGLRHPPPVRHGAGRRDRADLAAAPARLPLDGTGAAAPLRLRLLRHADAGGLPHQPALPRRPRLRLRHRPCAGRHREGLALVPRRQAREEAQHLHGFRRLRPRADRGRTTPRRAASSRMAARPAAC